MDKLNKHVFYSLLTIALTFAILVGCTREADISEPNTTVTEPEVITSEPETTVSEPEAKEFALEYDDCGILPCICPPTGTGELIAVAVFEGSFTAYPEGDWYEGNAIAPLSYTWDGPSEWAEHGAFA